MSGPLLETFENVWGGIQQQPWPSEAREAALLVFMTGAATAINELRKGNRADGVNGAGAALMCLETELEQFINKGVVQ